MFSAQLAGYKSGKGSVQLPLDQPLPEALLAEMVRFRIDEVRVKVAARRKLGGLRLESQSRSDS